MKAFIRSDAAKNTLLKASSSAGFTGLWLEASAPRCFFANEPLSRPSDLKGLAIRVPESEMSIRTVKVLGATPDPLSTDETYQALRHSIIDAAENNFVYYVQKHYYEVAPVFSEDMHSMSPNAVIISQKTYDALGEKAQEWVDEAAVAGREAQIGAYEDSYSRLMGFAGTLGIRIVKVDRGPFIEATRQILDEEREKPGVAEVIRTIEDCR